MLNLQSLKINPFTKNLGNFFVTTFGKSNSKYIDFLNFASTVSLENIANGDMVYHDVDHTIMVASVGQEIIRGKHLFEGGLSPNDAINYLLSLLCHDIGFVKGVCKKDNLAMNLFDDGEGGMVEISDSGSCAMLQPYHVSRGKLFVRERFENFNFLDIELIEECIERTRFPIPGDDSYQNSQDLPGLARAADLIGQLGDPQYLNRIPALFYEFDELGMNAEMNYHSPGDLRKGYAQFFWSVVNKYVSEGLSFLRATQEGKKWISFLHSHVFECENVK